MLTSLLIFSLSAFANGSWKDEKFPVPDFPTGYYWTPRSGPKVIHLPQKAREKPNALVLFQNELQVWKNDRYSKSYKFVSSSPVPFGEFKVSGYRIEKKSSAIFGVLTIKTHKGNQELRIFWKPNELWREVRPGIRVFHNACLL